jgi:sarcosine oxidase subunit beta
MAVSVVIVGAGIAGLSAAFHLAERDVRPILLVDKGEIGSGSSSRSGAINTMLMETEATTRARGISFDIFERFDRILKGYRFYQVGCLSIYNKEQFESARALHPMHRKAGARFEVLSARQVEDHFPDLRIENSEYGVIDQRGGYSEPDRYIPALAAKVRQLGVDIREHTPIKRFLVEGGRVRGVVLADGRQVNAEATVCTVNAWANALLKAEDQPMPVRNFVIERHVTRPFKRKPRLPAVNDDVRGIYYRSTEDLRLLIGGAKHELSQVPMPGSQFDMAKLAPDPACRPFLKTAAAGRLPIMDGVEFESHRVGLVSYPVDFKPVVGPMAALPGLYLGTHFCSGGFGYHPVAGLLLAEYIIDASEFSPDRFSNFDTKGYLDSELIYSAMVDTHAANTVGFVRKHH